MDAMDLVVKRLDELRQDQRDAFDRLERRDAAQDKRLRDIERRINFWAGGLTAVSGMAGTAFGVAIAYVKTRLQA